MAANGKQPQRECVLWQSLAGSSTRRVDGDYGFGVFGDELGHTLFRVRRPCDARPAVNALVVAFAVLAGVAGSVQVAVMAKLGDRVGVFGALAWAAALTALLALALLLVAKQSLSPFAEAARQPAWLWSGAIMSVIIVLAITVAGSRIGVIATVSDPPRRAVRRRRGDRPLRPARRGSRSVSTWASSGSPCSGSAPASR